MSDSESRLSEVPDNVRDLRACLFCSLIKTSQQFEEYGCTNCDWLDMKHNRDRVSACTSASFDGLLTLMDPDASWVAKWQRISGKQYCRGVYAISVNGAPPGHIVAEAKESGRPYHNRNRASYQST